jgi:hypothetical protein
MAAVFCRAGLDDTKTLFLHGSLEKLVFKLFVCILNMREYSGERPVIEPIREHFFSNIG